MIKLQTIVMLLCLSMAALQPTCAQETKAKEAPVREWYGGIEGGVPFGVGTLSSFGADKTRAGYAVGLFGGYRFNSVLSAELSAKWGKTHLAARDCCIASGYWLGTDGQTYHAPVAGMDGADYAHLKSAVALQQYGVRMNINLLGLFPATRQSRWRLELSPMITAVGTQADVKTIDEGHGLISDQTRWHLGAGGNVQVSYAIADRLHVGLYSGMTCLTGDAIDGLSERIHDARYLWESGLRIGWTLGRCRKKTREVAEPMSAVPAALAERKEVPARPKPVPEKTDAKATIGAQETTMIFPVVYFDFNQSVIKESEKAKLQDICQKLQAHPRVKIHITGWSDPVGSRRVNERLSLQRADAVKTWLVSQGIDAARMETEGMGSDHQEPDAAKARRVETKEQRKEAQR